MPHIFISYSSKDRPKTKAVARVFEKQGWDVWWDKDLAPGKAFDRAISNALDAANCIVVLWSENSVKSSWVMDEAYEGRERKILIPALIGPTRIPFGYRRIQYVDLTKWNGSATATAIKDLIAGVAKLIGADEKATGKPVAKTRPPTKAIKQKRTLSGALDGKTIVFTGALSESRKAHAEKVKAVGAHFVNTVSGKTDYLVVGKEPGEVKLQAAARLGTKKITEKQWLAMLNEAYRRTLLHKNVVFTGKLESPRTKQEKMARQLGAQVSGSISGKTDFLIVGEKPGKVKLDAAKKYDVDVIPESLWEEIVGTL